jgi:hypothetical protein
MMTQDEFIKRYHDYSTQSEEEAVVEAIMVNAEGIVGNRAIAVKFGDLGYGLMLQGALEYLSGKEVKHPETA